MTPFSIMDHNGDVAEFTMAVKIVDPNTVWVIVKDVGRNQGQCSTLCFDLIATLLMRGALIAFVGNDKVRWAQVDTTGLWFEVKMERVNGSEDGPSFRTPVFKMLSAEEIHTLAKDSL